MRLDYVCTFEDSILVFKVKRHCYIFVDVDHGNVMAKDNWFYMTSWNELTQVGGHDPNEDKAIEMIEKEDIPKLISEIKERKDSNEKETLKDMDDWQSETIRNFNK